jgi:hypothetical protein
MAVTPTPICLQKPRITPCQFVQGIDAANTYKTLCTGGTNGSKVVASTMVSTDNALAHKIIFSLQRGGTNYSLCYVTLPINSGTDGITPAVDLFAGGPTNLLYGLPIDNDGQRYLFLESGDTLVATFLTGLSASCYIYITTISADF